MCKIIIVLLLVHVSHFPPQTTDVCSDFAHCKVLVGSFHFLPNLHIMHIMHTADSTSSDSAVDFYYSVRFQFGFGLTPRFWFRFQNRHSTTFNKKYNQPSDSHNQVKTCLRSANKPTSLRQSSTRHSRRAIKTISVNQQTCRARCIERCCAF